ADEPGRSADEGPPRAVLISEPFYLGTTEVTQKQYQAAMGMNPSYFRGDELPVEQVSWNEAMAFTARVGQGLTLPTEAQWEMACRAGTSTAFSTGATTDALATVAFYGIGSQNAYQGGDSHSSPAGARKANAFGLRDMHGNVYEWCADWYDPAAYAP